MIVIPTLHPGLLARSGDDDGFSKYEHVVVDDMRKAARLMHALPTWNESILFETDNAGRRWRIFPTPQEVQWFIERFYAACARHPQWVERGLLSLTVDVETTKDAPLLSQLICVGLGFKAPDEEQVLNVPILCCGGFRYWASEDERLESWVRHLLRSVLGDPRVPKAFHNKAFDMAVLWANSMPVAGMTWDTMAAHHIEDGEMPHNLGFVSSTKTDGRFWKDDSKGDGGFLGIPDDTLRTYNLRDILVTQRIQHPLHEGLRARNQWALYIEQLENIDVMCRASIRGMLIDEQKRTSRELDEKGNFIGLQPKLEKQRDDAMMMLRQVSGNAAFDPAKPAQLQDLFFRQLGFPVVVTSQKTGKPKVDKEALMLLELMATTQEQRTALRGVIEFRQAEKFLGTFITGLGKFVHPQTWRFHTQWKLLAVSGRWTSSPNAQNWNSKVKSMFRAAPGFKFVGVDLSQAELRYIAYLAHDAALLQMYEHDINVHTVNACLLFKIQCPKKDDSNPQTDAFIRAEMLRVHGLDYATLPMPPEANWKAIRTLAKNFVFGSNYGAEAKTVYGILRAKRDAETNKLLFPSLLLSEVEALRIMWIRRLHPEIPRFWDDVQMQIRKAGGYFCPISGRARLFRGGFKRNEMLNIAIQMGVASWMNKKMVVIQRQFDRDTGGAAQIIQQVHDALNAECPDGYAVESGEIMRRELNEPFQLLGMKATLPADKALIHDYLHKV